jgi:starch-binding outer membrane protein SusE/F
MKNKTIFLIFFSLIVTLIACEKVEEKVYLAENVVPAELITIPDLNLKRANAGDTLVFVGTSLDVGFQASSQYSFRVASIGGLEESSSLGPTSADTVLRITIDDLNSRLASRGEEYATTPLVFLIESSLILDAGDGAYEFLYFSTPITVDVTIYGDPRLDLINSGTEQSLDLGEEDGMYSGLIALQQDVAFTMTNPETGVSYGGSDGTLTVDGPALVPTYTGQHMLTVNIPDMTYELVINEPKSLSLLGSGVDQVVTSLNRNGIYTGMVNLAESSPFTIYDAEEDITYGGNNDILAIDGGNIIVTSMGWYMLTVNTNDLTYSVEPYSIGVVGAFSGWNAPDVPMEYDPVNGVWTATLDLPVGPMKFRLNNDWATNWGPGVAADTDVDLPADGKMDLLNEWGNINIIVEGNYSIELTVDGAAGSVVFTLN